MDPETLVAHELVGLDVEIVDSPNADLVGVAGRVVDETKRTLIVATGERDRTVRVPKADATFRFTVDCETRVIVDGERLVARPARRTERTGGSLWQ